MVDSMHPVFVARGPVFKQNYQTSKEKIINSVDVYPLMCLILGLVPSANNGSLENIMDLLIKSTHDNQEDIFKFNLKIIKIIQVNSKFIPKSFYFFNFFFILFLFVTFFVFIFILQLKNKDRASTVCTTSPYVLLDN